MMRKITKPHKARDVQNIFTEGINYFTTGTIPIWGKGDNEMLRCLQKLTLHGQWLNLAAGDGRYTLQLLQKVDRVIAADIDASALSKLWHTTPQRYRKKLTTKIFNITKKFPFRGHLFDGVFCTGILHLFSEKMLRKIFSEIQRVVTLQGTVIIDFAAEIKRRSSDGTVITFGNEPGYTLAEGKKILRKFFRDYHVQMSTSKFVDKFPKANPPFTTRGNVIVFVAKK